VKRSRHPIGRRLDVELTQHPHSPGPGNRPGQLGHRHTAHRRLLQRMTATHQLGEGGLHTDPSLVLTSRVSIVA